MNAASEEQQIAIDHIKRGHNVVLDAVAGSGKSTTILSMAVQLPEKRVLQIAYNAMLRKEVEKKLETGKIGNIVVHTFHSLAVSYYLDSAHTDSGIRKILMERIPPKRPIPPIDILVLDEAQDMSILYFQFMVKFTLDMGSPFQLFVLGDYMQGLYEFKGADIRTLTFAATIWEGHSLLLSPVFHSCTLEMSYRITRPMARFANEVLLGEERLKACKDGEPVVYIRNSRRNLEIVVLSQIHAILAAGERPGDIFVLGASVKGINSHIRKMENALVEKGVPCYVPMFDTERIDEKITDNKVVFSTFHSVKGRERKYVFVMGFDQSYFDIYAQNLPSDECPNTLYVGCTRATKKLFLLEIDEYSTNRPLDFLKKTHYDMRDSDYVYFKGIPRSIFYERTTDAIEESSASKKDQFHDITPTDLVKFVPEYVLDEIAPLLSTIFIQETEPDPEKEIRIPNVIETSLGFFEDVCDLNGISIPSMYYDYIYRVYGNSEENVGANIMKHIIRETLKDTKDGECLYLKSMVEKMPEECRSPSEYLFLSNLFVATREKLLFKLKQIGPDDYGWLNQEDVDQCILRMDALIQKELARPFSVEYPVMQYDMEQEVKYANEILAPFFPGYGKKFRFSARLDLVTEQCIWEFKCTSSITVEHKLQVVLYAWLWKITHPGKQTRQKTRETRILNIKTGEKWLLNASMEELTTVVVALLRGKYEREPPKTDEEFVQECRKAILSTN